MPLFLQDSCQQRQHHFLGQLRVTAEAREAKLEEIIADEVGRLVCGSISDIFCGVLSYLLWHTYLEIHS